MAWVAALSCAKGRAGFFRIPLKLFLLCRGEGRWGTESDFRLRIQRRMRLDNA